ncbi:hypothetical protein GGF31_008600 [Allomyces arbusculus]|nr:hypothetical protein GGF31_008600 [Allomyces arbusculus]
MQIVLAYACGKQITSDHFLPTPMGEGKWAPLDTEALGKAMVVMLLELPMRST